MHLHCRSFFPSSFGMEEDVYPFHYLFFLKIGSLGSTVKAAGGVIGLGCLRELSEGLIYAGFNARRYEAG